VAKNMVIDHYRVKGQNPIILDNLDTVLDSNQDIEKKAAEKDDMRIVTAALGKLNDDSRLAVSMYYIEQEPISEVAKALNRSQGATRVLIHRGMKQLREILEA